MAAHKNRLRIVFAGTPEFAARHLETLLHDKSFDIAAVFTQPDRPAGRGKKLTPSPVKALALTHHLPVYQPQSLKNSDAQEQLADLQPDILVVVAYGLLLPKQVLDTPRLGCINVHASLLPRWRGAAPIQRAIEAGDSITGVTIMQMDEGLDTGAMLVKQECPILDTDTAASLHDRLAAIGGPSLIKTLHQLATGTAIPVAQDNTLSSYANKISKAEALLNWQLDAETLAMKVRAFNPAPVAFSNIGGERVKLWQANAVAAPATSRPGTLLPGTILVSNAEGISVACGGGALQITELQLPGKKCLPAAEILKSRASLFAPGNTFDTEELQA